MKTYSSSFTQGGQTELHKFRMLKQVSGTTFKVSLCVAIIALVALCYVAQPYQAYWNLLCYYKALVRNSLDFLPKGFFDSSWYYLTPGKLIEVSDYQLQHSAWYSTSMLYMQSVFIKQLKWGLFVWLLSFIGISGFWIFKGSQKHKKKILTGTTLVDSKTMVKLIRKKKEVSDLHVGGVPLIKDKETEHFLITGATGSGKTNCLIELLQQIRKRGDRAVIVDSTSELFQRFFQEKKDLLLNPLDTRSQNWNLWSECEEKYHFNEFAECLIPGSGHNDPFWTNAARDIFVETAKMLQDDGNSSYKELINYSIKKPIKDVADFYVRSSVASMMNVAAEKTSMSIRSTLATAIRSFESLAEKGDFSIRNWMLNNQDDQWLFLSCQSDQRALLRPLFSGWLSIATRSLLAAGANPTRKTWFIIDELPTLNHLPDLPKALAEVRKYGGCFIIGLQSVSQLENIYGRSTTQTMSGLTGTKILFRASETTGAKRMSELLGEQEVSEAVESISFGAHQMRDGVNLSDQKRTKVTVPYTDFLQLNNLEAYLKLPGNYPIAKIQFDYHDFSASVNAFSKPHEVLNPTLDSKVLELYGQGISYSDIKENIKKTDGVNVSDDNINAITDKLLPDIAQWRSRPLQKIYPIIYADKMIFKVSESSTVVTKSLYSLLGITPEGHRQILGLYVTEAEGVNFWLEVLEDLKQRGVEDILIACMDGFPRCSEAVKAVFPTTYIQLCVIHLIRNSLKYIAKKDHKEFLKDIKTVYQAPSKDIAEQNLGELDEKYSIAIKLWHLHWENLSHYFQYPREIRAHIYTSNAVEELHREIRRFNNLQDFTSENSLIKLSYCACQKLSEKWTSPLQDWISVLSQLYKYYGGRLKLEFNN
jgi:type IV conjugative transfer system coupling protein TraD